MNLKLLQVEGDRVWNSFSRGLKKSGIQLFIEAGMYICPYPPLSNYTKIFATITYIIFIVFNIIGGMTIIASAGDLIRISETLFYYSMIIPTLIGYIIIHYKKDVLERMFKMIDEEFFIYNQEGTSDLQMIRVEQHRRYLKIQKTLQYLLYITYFMWALVAPIYGIYFGDGSEKTNPRLIYDIPVPMWVPFSSRDLSTFLICYIAQVVIGFSVVLIYIAYIMTIVGFSAQVITQLKILSYSIRSLDSRSNYLYSKLHEENLGQRHSLKNKYNNSNNYKHFSDCLHILFHHNILHYNNIVTFFEMFLEFTKVLSAIVLGETVIILCNGLFLLTMVSGTNANTIKFTLLIIVCLANIFFFCICGTLISVESEKVHESLYFSNWYNFPEPLKRSIRILQIRTMRNLEFQAGIYPLNLDTFIQLLRATYSIFNVLIHVNEGN